ncbi:hypothetical protein AUEXF2481DRAFT_85391 [Aureobasidium subglaciale EXF-2481]|uniref:Dynamin N-terminal domain-containing protein n=1 Tax=Aureobasidium subglaciale (strain EXF-2481) TaxID=1043005 RepID=A0A074ZN76_AURSE|nr:uncharacterized protein AUEXF2481DRAFT_85391 [Aureobasidium subglaciale EXF-2481]KEQ99826.1 hypothetical protein AUEXF2481DRAFT_85391 [Aureobasidium subglaciale EXF-2481]
MYGRCSDCVKLFIVVEFSVVEKRAHVLRCLTDMPALKSVALDDKTSSFILTGGIFTGKKAVTLSPQLLYLLHIPLLPTLSSAPFNFPPAHDLSHQVRLDKPQSHFTVCFSVTEAFANVDKVRPHRLDGIFDAVHGLQSIGVYGIIALPYIVMCGDRAVGKSSLLESLTGISSRQHVAQPFTWKASAIIYRLFAMRGSQNKRTYTSASIVPGPFCKEEDRRRLEIWGWERYSIPTQVSALIRDASMTMSLPLLSEAPQDQSASSQNILEIAISGPDCPTITLIDTPGLITTRGRHQPAGDIEFVETLVKSYIDEGSTTVLAVYSGDSYFELRQMTTVIPKTDGRTLGIITKPDKPRSHSTLEFAYVNLILRHKMYNSFAKSII